MQWLLRKFSESVAAAWTFSATLLMMGEDSLWDQLKCNGKAFFLKKKKSSIFYKWKLIASCLKILNSIYE